MGSIIAEMQTTMKQEMTELFAAENSPHVAQALGYEVFCGKMSAEAQVIYQARI